MYLASEIAHVHLEPTTRCNAACPMCARNALGSTAPGLTLTELREDEVREILPAEFLAHVNAVDLCGAYGDPIVATELLGIVRYLRQDRAGRAVTVFTNGGVRTLAWWRELASALGPAGLVVFAIDGLEDTLSIYRRGVRFDSVIERATAFIEAGGRARWDFLVFRHNEHELDRARSLSRELGFEDFCVKKSSRFLKSAYDYVPELAGEIDLKQFPVFDADGHQVGLLRPASDPRLVNETLSRCASLSDPKGALGRLLDTTSIRCRVQESRSVFVSAGGQAFPCCWTYVQAMTPILNRGVEGVDAAMYELVLANGGFEELAARGKGIGAIIEGDLFRAIRESWEKPSLAQGRQRVCARTCGQEWPAFEAQFERASDMPAACRTPAQERPGKLLPQPRLGFFGAAPQEQSSGLLLCDPLTGLVAYPSFERYLVAHLPGVAAFGLHLGIGDVDGLKEYVTSRNAADPTLFGHLAGNHCMREVGRITRSWARRELADAPFSLCGTFGGDEVILAVAGTRYDQFLSAIRLLAADLRKGAPRSCSFALATLGNRVVSPEHAHDAFRGLVVYVDRALFRYKAERSGRAAEVEGVVADLGPFSLPCLKADDEFQTGEELR